MRKIVKTVSVKYKNLKIGQQLLVGFLSLTIFPLCLLSVLCFSLSAYIIGGKTESYAFETICQLSDNIDNFLSQIELTSLTISYNSTIQELLSSAEDLKTYSRQELYQLEKNLILTYNYSSMRDITLFTRQGTGISVPYTMMNAPENYYPPDNMELPVHTAVWYNNKENGVIQMMRNIESAQNYRNIGKLCISLYNGYLTKLASNINFDKDGFIMVVDGSYQPVMVGEGQELFIPFIKENTGNASGHFIQRIGGLYYRFFYRRSAKTGWISVGVISINQLFKQVLYLGLAIIGGMIVIGSVAIVISKKLSYFFSSKIYQVLAGMHQAAGGDFSVKLLLEESTNEFNDLNAGFNIMIEKINSLIDTVYKTEILQKESEFKALQAEINPHFLYNTLDTICWQAKLKGNEEIYQTTYSLAALLRASVGNKHRFITVEEELKLINSYLNIQKARYRDKITVTVHLPKELYSYQIPKLILQPIVENAFVHGLELKRGTGTLIISGTLEGSHLCLMVKDDGVGMTKVQADKIFTDQERQSGSIGLKNVQKRIALLFGPDCGIEVESELGEGTAVALRVPAYVTEEGKA